LGGLVGEERPHELGCDDGHDGIAVSLESADTVSASARQNASGDPAESLSSLCVNSQSLQFGEQRSHASGNPWSQRECAGLNAAVFVVSAVDEVVVGPGARASRALRCRPRANSSDRTFSWAVGVAQGADGTASCACAPSSDTTNPIDLPAAMAARFLARCCSGVPPQTVAEGVAHGEVSTARTPLASLASGVGQEDGPAEGGDPEESLSQVRRARAECAQNACPDGVARSLHVPANSVEPDELSWACSRSPSLCESVRAGRVGGADDGGGGDLLAEDDAGAALADEVEERWPQVAGVIGALPLAGG
jgi:hypothetical protein